MSENQVSKRIHPLVAGAAVSVILASLVGIAAMTGVLPNSNSTPKIDNQTGQSSASNAAASALPSSATNVEVGTPKIVKRENLPPSEQEAVRKAEVPVTHTRLTQNEPNPEPVVHKICETCGIVESVRAIEVQADHGSGLGAVAGALLGGVLGNQVGNGNGRTLATVAGAVGGGVAGNAIEKRERTNTVYEVKVRMDNGQIRTFKPSLQPQYREGERVHISNGSVVVG
ncbi:glycine zipper 2TM domain-containing protein [Undibacterium sp. SXout11W]|uniref:glycine zipper 2TM domain-containing protein n=1 Tax=Undibacterium sp. SXout11W TaxID=3413050 RepID=UPI003BF05450